MRPSAVYGVVCQTGLALLLCDAWLASYVYLGCVLHWIAAGPAPLAGRRPL
jgi:hypothetical protein